VGEPLPIDAKNERQLRMSLIAQSLAQQGHDVTWWTSTFDHTHKRQRFDRNTRLEVAPNLVLQLLFARPYSSNISIDRLRNHRQCALAFEQVAKKTSSQDLPDVIFATMPTVELAAAAARFGAENGIPVIVDVRDLHPDIYLSLVPRIARGPARLALGPLYRDLQTALKLATSIVAIAPSFLDWALTHAGRAARETDRVFPLAYPELNIPDEAVRQSGEELEAMGVRSDRKIVWYVGTFNRWIDLEAPIETARILADSGRTDIQFVLSGSGDFGEKWRTQAAGLPNVVFTGWVDIPKLVHMRNISWAGLAPYRAGFHTVGNKLFEYMAGGLPVLLSIDGDARKIIDAHDAGMAYSGGDPESLMKAIDSMLSDGVRDRMSQNSLDAFNENYSAAKVYGEMIDFVLGFGHRKSHAGS
jgi:glycosyltransferase involved in cell wall biosynthesis